MQRVCILSGCNTLNKLMTDERDDGDAAASWPNREVPPGRDPRRVHSCGYAFSRGGLWSDPHG